MLILRKTPHHGSSNPYQNLRCHVERKDEVTIDGGGRYPSPPLVPIVPVWPNAGQRLSLEEWLAIYEEDIDEILCDIMGFIDLLYERGYDVKYNVNALSQRIITYLYNTSINTLKKKHVDLSGF